MATQDDLLALKRQIEREQTKAHDANEAYRSDGKPERVRINPEDHTASILEKATPRNNAP